ncbi:hypothetical protein D9757_000178 [Collybiopsis confluens]|uniref:Golgi apparatus membrane protein TVP38 n=1 Tax=Collybiopsis confluens TaxID=2823264 RepID=A0A8H5I3G1_9AGAR|nr:hypothetical protein D9757_000178 [Collybiopsis confluens]
MTPSSSSSAARTVSAPSFNEKPLLSSSSLPPSPSPTRHHHQQQPTPSLSQRSYPHYARPRGLRVANLIRPLLPVILYALTTLGFLIAVAFYKIQLFAALDELSRWLQADPTLGHSALFFLIFLTTFPPIPLYSTLIILSGYTFGPWSGAVISYFAALSGAIVVFIISRTLLRESISRWLSCTVTLKRVVRAIEKRPKLLFLIRLAPYPYNVMNCLLAASPTLTFQTYTLCTALSLFKVIIHTSLGASIHSFRDYHMANEETSQQSRADTVARMWTIFGITLCIAIFIYLSYVARKAIDEELEHDCVLRRCEDGDGDEEETVAFLAPRSDVEQMAESHHQLISPRPSISL